MLDRMTAETTTFCRSQVEVLQGVVVEIALHKPEDTRGEIAVVARTAADRVRSGVRRCRGQVVGGVNRVGVQNQLVVESLARGIESDVQILGLAVAAGQGKAQIQTTVPACEDSGVQALLISRLLGRTPQHGDRSLRRLDRARGAGCDYYIVTARGHRTDHRLAPQTHVQVACARYVC